MFTVVWRRNFRSRGPIKEGAYSGLYMRNKKDLISDRLSPLLMGNLFQDLHNKIYNVVIYGGEHPLIDASYEKRVVISSCQGNAVPREISDILREEDFEEKA